jgi:hypothetical protein
LRLKFLLCVYARSFWFVLSLLSFDKMKFVSGKHSKYILEQLNDLRQRTTLCDVVLKAGVCRVYAHRAVLSAWSRYFCAMFTSKLAESRQGTLSCVKMKAEVSKSTCLHRLLLDCTLFGSFICTALQAMKMQAMKSYEIVL